MSALGNDLILSAMNKITMEAIRESLQVVEQIEPAPSYLLVMGPGAFERLKKTVDFQIREGDQLLSLAINGALRGIRICVTEYMAYYQWRLLPEMEMPGALEIPIEPLKFEWPPKFENTPLEVADESSNIDHDDEG